MGQIRSFVEGDIPRVARLHRTVFKTEERGDASSLDAYHAYFMQVFLESPLRADNLSSLVYEEDDRIVGFLGVVPRRMTMSGHRFQAAIGSQFVVDPATAFGSVAVRLARTFLDGPQDLSISDEASDIARKIWEGLGGKTALLRSIHWVRPLRPATLAVATATRRPRLAPLALALVPIATMVDAMATRITDSHFRQSKPEGSSAEDLTEQAVLSYLSAVEPTHSLHVEYDEATLHWLLERARQRKSPGSLHAAVVRTGRRIIGWYLYHLDRQRVANVLHIDAEHAAIREVLDHLFYQTATNGAIAATGRLEPRYLQALSDTYCLFHRRGPWVLLSTRVADLVRSFETDDAMFSRFEGEWCLGYC
jgi:hypothetical protein